MNQIIPSMETSIMKSKSIKLDDGMKKIIVGTLNDRYCRQMKDNNSIYDEESEICRLFTGHNGVHCWGKLYA